ncbi:MAG: YbhB/YbcL family Raf kinase inhibitor-like protein [Bryobacteraceae bacterium]
MSFTLSVNSLEEGGKIPSRYTCEGDNVSPPVSWKDCPAGTQAFALIVEDPDAPTGPWAHWILWNIPRSVSELPQDFHPTPPIEVGRNGFGRQAYGGPCPPQGSPAHRYFFRLYALDADRLAMPSGATREQILPAIESHAIGSAHFMGLCGRPETTHA